MAKGKILDVDKQAIIFDDENLLMFTKKLRLWLESSLYLNLLIRDYVLKRKLWCGFALLRLLVNTFDELDKAFKIGVGIVVHS